MQIHVDVHDFISHQCVIRFMEGEMSRGLGRWFNSFSMLANLTGISFFRNCMEVFSQAAEATSPRNMCYGLVVLVVCVGK